MTPESRRILLSEWMKSKSRFNHAQEDWKIEKDRLDGQAKDLMDLQGQIMGLETDLNPTDEEINMSEPWRGIIPSQSNG